jgi:hypothetical protein
MQVRVLIGTTSLTTLLNSGSTHNYVDVDAVARAGTVFQHGVGLQVVVANNDRMSSPGHCTNLAIAIADESFSITCYGLTLGSFNMAFDVQWLESLGPMLWDFGRRTMSFVRDGRWVLWTTTPSSSGPAALAPGHWRHH